jgi:hypothetical protein
VSERASGPLASRPGASGLDVLHDQVVEVERLVVVDVEHADDVGMPELGRMMRASR